VDTATIISLALGCEGAVVATTLAVRQVFHDRRTLKVDCRVGYALDVTPAKALIRVRAVNEGRRPVEMTAVNFRLEDGRELFPPTPVAGRDKLPALLGDGQSVTLHYDQAALDRLGEEAESPVAFAVVADAGASEYLAPYPDKPWKAGGHTERTRLTR